MKTFRCVFYGDLYPNEECYDRDTAVMLRQLVLARKRFAHGPLVDYFEHKNCIGFVRLGSEQHPGCAVVVSNEAPRCVITHFLILSQCDLVLYCYSPSRTITRMHIGEVSILIF